LLAAGAVCSCAGVRFVSENTRYAAEQTRVLLERAGRPDGTNFPRSVREDGSFVGTNMYDWTSGFFPGTLWYLYALTGDEQWHAQARQWTGALDSLKTFRGTHDLGFMIYCSFGNGELLDPSQEYRDVIVEAADALSTRWSPKTGVIKSWNGFRGWDDTRFEYPVIIDNMMNLEMLFAASRITGDQKYRDIALSHADTTLKNHLRDDFSSYHVVGYNPETGAVEGKRTWQGYSDNSTWARGQAWAVYGFTMAHRETGERRYLDAAVGAADWYLAHLPDDMVPAWDFNAGQEGYTPGARSHASRYAGVSNKDASAAAIVCSALFDLARQAGRPDYRRKAEAMLRSLASPEYRAAMGANGGFMLMHCTGAIPLRSEIDVPLVYADYYFMEALTKSRR
jgi:rhamnogalacturonyl hydrolase YesR